MDFAILTNNWAAVLLLAWILIAVLVTLVWFMRLPREDQIAKVREWLLWAVITAERQLGGGTGQLKLRSVYDMFVVRFPTVSKLISFEFFSNMVDEALVEMRKLIETNKAVQAYVSGKDGGVNG